LCGMYVGGVGRSENNSQMYGNPSQVLTISTLELSDLAENRTPSTDLLLRWRPGLAAD
jgi:hypothetical protein